METSSDILGVSERLAAVQARIAAAARGADRAPAEITLVAVTKTHGAASIRPALAAGHRVFGENRVQEAEEKWPALKQDFPNLRLHLIGPLQRNKVRRAVRLFDVIETVDRPELAQALSAAMAEERRRPEVFVQVNTGEEIQKAGIAPTEAAALVRLARDELGLAVRGLMCIPPLGEPPGLHFALLREIARGTGVPDLSMGMSGDYAEAIRFGATFVRIGTAIFGERSPSSD